MARPRKDIKSIKAIRINIRMTIDAYLKMAHNAESLGITIPDYIRRRVDGKSLPRIKVSPIDRKLFVELGRIGNNLNQLAKNAHLGMRNPIILQEQLLELKKTLNALKSNIISHDSKTD